MQILMKTVKKLLKTVIAAAVLAAVSYTAAADTVLITGSNSGIGLEFAREYAAKGWTVIATHRRDTIPNTLPGIQTRRTRQSARSECR